MFTKKLYFTSVIVLTLLLATSLIITKVNAQPACTIVLPAGTWTGQTQNGVGNVSASNTTTSITDQGNNQFIVSDFSGGFIGHFGFSNNNAVTIEIDCNNDVIATNINTDYGSCDITGGSWDATNNELTINWELSGNRIVEVTKFTLN